MTSNHARGPLHRRSPAAADALVRLHTAVGTLLDGRLAKGASVREVGRVLGIGSHLSWKLLAFRRAADVDAMAESLPGRRGWRTILGAFEEDEASRPAGDAVRAALAEFDRFAEDGTTDRTTRISPRSRSTSAPSGPLAKARAEEYLRHRRSWPIYGRAKIVTWLVSRDPYRSDLGAFASLMIFHGLERNTPGAPLEIASPIMRDHEIRERVPPEVDPRQLFGRQGPMPPLIESLSSPGVVGRELQVIDEDTGSIGFTEVDPARAVPLTLAFGAFLPAMGPLQGGPDDRVNLSLPTMGAIEVGILDLFWLRDLPAGGPWEVRPTAVTLQAGSEVIDWNKSTGFPEIESAIESSTPTDVALPEPLRELSPTYRAGLRSAAAALGRELDEFELFRTVVHHPTPRMNVLATRLVEQSPG